MSNFPEAIWLQGKEPSTNFFSENKNGTIFFLKKSHFVNHSFKATGNFVKKTTILSLN